MKRIIKIIYCLVTISLFAAYTGFAHETKDIDTNPSEVKWYDRFHISGLIEIEANYAETDFTNPSLEDEKNSNIDLGAVELGIDANIGKYVDGHVLFKWEAEELFVDEGFIKINGAEKVPAYIIAGKQYIPFEHFDSHFITDPATLTLGETNEGALVAGYQFNREMVDIALGVFNGKVDKFDTGDHITDYVGAVTINPVENVKFGASYISNLAASDSLSEEIQGDGLDRYVAGWSAFVSASFFDRLDLMAEYVGAVNDFQAGELYDPAETERRKPAAWCTELGFAINDEWNTAVRYEGAIDGGESFLPTILWCGCELGVIY
jgi:hypothetical protein